MRHSRCRRATANRSSLGTCSPASPRRGTGCIGSRDGRCREAHERVLVARQRQGAPAGQAGAARVRDRRGTWGDFGRPCGACGAPSSAAVDRASGRASATMRPSRLIRRMRSPGSPAPGHDAALRACCRQRIRGGGACRTDHCPVHGGSHDDWGRSMRYVQSLCSSSVIPRRRRTKRRTIASASTRHWSRNSNKTLSGFPERFSRSRPSGLPSRPAGSSTCARPLAWSCTVGNSSCG